MKDLGFKESWFSSCLNDAGVGAAAAADDVGEVFRGGMIRVPFRLAKAAVVSAMPSVRNFPRMTLRFHVLDR